MRLVIFLDGITDNQLNYVKDNFNQPGNSGLYSNDIDDQTNTANYTYDALGNLISDYSEEIGTIEWTAYGKIKSITRSTGVKPNLEFKYDASGNRICKKVIEQGGDITSTYYVLDASGNTMATYTRNHQTTDVQLTETHIYGAARLGVVNRGLKVGDETNNCISGGDLPETDEYLLIRGERAYELSNHLGNVMVVISDRKKAIKKTYGGSCSTWCSSEYYQVYVLSVSDYYPFGMQMEERTWSISIYRFGFQGQEKDDEVVEACNGNHLAFKYRIHDARLGRFLSVDPLSPEYPWNSSYAFSENRVISAIELEGLESQELNSSNPDFIYDDNLNQIQINRDGTYKVDELKSASDADAMFGGTRQDWRELMINIYGMPGDLSLKEEENYQNMALKSWNISHGLPSTTTQNQSLQAWYEGTTYYAEDQKYAASGLMLAFYYAIAIEDVTNAYVATIG